ncbi:tetratricopeptide repeat protein [Streptomyces phaeochromogenes]|uniref:tetratricopeptide repeat protein n=1 Tax=Streptomyces phaeochromogenes TaxID=1923 RepID=UPI0036760BA8
MTPTRHIWTPARLMAAAALAVAVPAVLAAAGVRLWWLLGLGIVVAAVGGVFAPGLADSYQRARQRGEDSGVALAKDSLLAKVREITNPVLLGVHPARHADPQGAAAGPADAAGSGDRVPPYVPRDIHQRLVEGLASGGFVLLVGESTAGKSRAAYEAMQAALSDHTLIAPRSRAVLPEAIELAVRLPRCVLWLDNAERFLGPDGLTQTNVARVIGGSGHHRVVLATIRSAEMARYTDTTHPDAADTTEDRHVLEQATQLRLRRPLTVTERERALTRAWDQRIADALDHSGEYGLAEYLAAGPELLNDWENAWEAGHPRAAALIAAAVDCRRAGLTRPLPRALLESLHGDYLVLRGGERLGPEPLEEAWAWATHPRRATTALIRPCADPDGEPTAVEVFDYLVDATQRDTALSSHVPEQTLTGALAESDATEADQIGVIAYEYGRYELAAQAFERAARMNTADLGPEHPYTLTNRSNRVVMLGELGRYEEAEAEARTVLEIRTRALGTEHPDTLTSRTNLASALFNCGQEAQAETEARNAMEGFTRVLGPDHPHALGARNTFAVTLVLLGRHAEGDAEARATLEGRLRVLGPDHPDTLISHHNLGLALAGLDRYEDAEAELRAALEGFTRVLAPEHPTSTATRSLLSDVLASLGRLQEAEAEARAVLDVKTRALGPEHTEVLATRTNLGILLRRLERYEEAEAEHAEVLKARTRLLGRDHTLTLSSRNNRAVALSHIGRGEEAVAEHRHVLEARTRLQGLDHEETFRSHANLAVTLGELGLFEEAEAEARIALEGRTRILGPDHPDTANSRDTLAGLLRDQGRHDEASRVA